MGRHARHYLQPAGMTVTYGPGKKRMIIIKAGMRNILCNIWKWQWIIDMGRRTVIWHLRSDHAIGNGCSAGGGGQGRPKGRGRSLQCHVCGGRCRNPNKKVKQTGFKKKKIKSWAPQLCLRGSLFGIQTKHKNKPDTSTPCCLWGSRWNPNKIVIKKSTPCCVCGGLRRNPNKKS